MFLNRQSDRWLSSDVCSTTQLTILANIIRLIGLVSKLLVWISHIIINFTCVPEILLHIDVAIKKLEFRRHCRFTEHCLMDRRANWTGRNVRARSKYFETYKNTEQSAKVSRSFLIEIWFETKMIEFVRYVHLLFMHANWTLKCWLEYNMTAIAV